MVPGRWAIVEIVYFCVINFTEGQLVWLSPIWGILREYLKSMSHFLASKSSIAAKCELGDNRFELAVPPWNDWSCGPPA